MNFKNLVVALVVLCVLGGVQTAAAEQASSHEGTVVAAGDGKLSMKTDDGKEHSHAIDGTVQITVNGRPGKLEDLQEGVRVRVVTNPDGKVAAVSTVDTKKK